MAHGRATLAEFQEGETRLIYARRRQGDATLFELVNGTAATIRSWAKENLLCPVDGCESPALTTVNRGVRARDGFKHLVRTDDHGPESLFHIEAKGHIADWLRRRYPQVIVREEEPSNKNRDRVADIMATALNGDRIAIEIQYSYLEPAIWLKRHESYRDQKILDVWLFGHHGDQLTRVRGTEDQVVLSPTHELVLSWSSRPISSRPQTVRRSAACSASRPRCPLNGGLPTTIVFTVGLRMSRQFVRSALPTWIVSIVPSGRESGAMPSSRDIAWFA
ncbi:hypothetical protein E3T37_12640 [Cryobacterium sp. TMT2-10]|nr:hypothetical protein E3T37_12640 [Cryobacterium sp. TMT2-10]